MSINKVILVGNLGNDPEFKAVGSTDLCSFSLATSENYKDKNGDWKEVTEWHSIKVWGKPAKACADYLFKGSSVYVEGSIKSNDYKNRDGDLVKGKDIVAVKVDFLDKKKPDDGKWSPKREDNDDRSRRRDDRDDRPSRSRDADRYADNLKSDDDGPF